MKAIFLIAFVFAAVAAAHTADPEVVTLQWYGVTWCPDCQLFSRTLDEALTAIKRNDTRPWVHFEFYPCPNGCGGATLAECEKDMGYGKTPACCINDKYEACMAQRFNCFGNSTACDFTLRAKMARFLRCFEGQKIGFGICDADPKECLALAELDEHFEAIDACARDDNKVRAAGSQMEALCKQRKGSWWPYIVVNGNALADGEAIPILPILCKAYKSSPKPSSCQALGFF